MMDVSLAHVLTQESGEPVCMILSLSNTDNEGSFWLDIGLLSFSKSSCLSENHIEVVVSFFLLKALIIVCTVSGYSIVRCVLITI